MLLFGTRRGYVLEVKGMVTGDFNGEREWVDIKVYCITLFEILIVF